MYAKLLDLVEGDVGGARAPRLRACTGGRRSMPRSTDSSSASA
jgi:hypothetical protein